jgi:hypothetical protein
LKKAVEGYMSAFDLPKAEIAIHLVEEIFKPLKGETESQYDARIGREMHHLDKVANARRLALSRGEKLGTVTTLKQLDKWAESKGIKRGDSEPTFDPKTMEWR